MKYSQIFLDNDKIASLHCYIIENSDQFQTGKLRPAVIVCPGGGYAYIADREAEPVAIRYLTYGFHAFVVRYSCGDKATYPRPLVDLAKSVSIIRKNVRDWYIDENKISLVGFSAGAHLAAMLGTNWDKSWLLDLLNCEPDEIKPNAMILAYGPYDLYELYSNTGINDQDKVLRDTFLERIFGIKNPKKEQLYELSPVNHVSQNTPPSFIWHTYEDELVPVSHSLKLAQTLGRFGVPFELHIFHRGPHGLSLSDETVERGKNFINTHVANWHNLSIEWLKEIFNEE